MRELSVPRAGVRGWPLALGLVLDPPGVAGGVEPDGVTVLVTPDRQDAPGAPGGDVAGVVGLWSPGWDDVTSRHLAVALAAYRSGYFLLHTVRVRLEASAGGSVIGERDWVRLWALAMRTDADGLFVLGLGPGDLGVLEPMAAELRLTLHEVGTAVGGGARDDPAGLREVRLQAAGGAGRDG